MPTNRDDNWISFLHMHIQNVYLQFPLDEPSQLLLGSLKDQLFLSLHDVSSKVHFPSVFHTTVQYLGDQTSHSIQSLIADIETILWSGQATFDNPTLHKISYWHSFAKPEINFLLQPHASDHLVNCVSEQLFWRRTDVHASLFSLPWLLRDDKRIMEIISQLKFLRDSSFAKPYRIQPDFSRLQIIGAIGGKKQILEEIDLRWYWKKLDINY